MRALVMLLVVLSLTACERREPLATGQPPSSTGPSPTGSPEAPVEGASGTQGSSGTAARADALPDAQRVEIVTYDGVTLHGTLYAASEPTANAVVLVHSLGTSEGEWSAWVEAFRAPPSALSVLTIDLRGHGESTRAEDGGRLDQSSFDAEAWALTGRDVAAATQWLVGNVSPVHPARVAVVGADMGATALVRAAAQDPSLDVLVVLSPGRAYRGVDSILVATEMGPRRLLALAARRDADNVETAEALARITGGEARVLDGEGHGVELLAAHEGLIDRVVGFVGEGLAAPRPVAAPPTELPTEPANDEALVAPSEAP